MLQQSVATLTAPVGCDPSMVLGLGVPNQTGTPSPGRVAVRGFDKFMFFIRSRVHYASSEVFHLKRI
ncbi:hypothetical protein MCERE19_03043 [Spirosomataceae bacterium]